MEGHRRDLEPEPNHQPEQGYDHERLIDEVCGGVGEAGEGEEVLVVECDLGSVEAARRSWPFFRDRRIDAYMGITRRWIDGE